MTFSEFEAFQNRSEVAKPRVNINHEIWRETNKNHTVFFNARKFDHVALGLVELAKRTLSIEPFELTVHAVAPSVVRARKRSRGTKARRANQCTTVTTHIEHRVDFTLRITSDHYWNTNDLNGFVVILLR